MTLVCPMEGDFGGPDPLVDQKGELQLFFLKGRDKPTDDDGSGMSIGIDIWHTHTTGGWAHAGPPVRIWKGYCGSMNCEMEMKNGRILFPFSYYSNSTWGHGAREFEAYTYKGRGVCTLLYSDDYGDTWKLSPSRLRVETPDLSTDEGLIEPVVTQLNDGRAWMLLRTQWGRFYQLFSPDGAVVPSAPHPYYRLRLAGRTCPTGRRPHRDAVELQPPARLCLWWAARPAWRHHLGRWEDLARIPRDLPGSRRAEPPPPTGDHGTTYPIPMAAYNGQIITTDGLPNPHYNLMLDPAYLLETSQQDDFSHGLDDWSILGVHGVELVAHPQQPNRQVLAVRKPDAAWPAGAVWNFPAGRQENCTFACRCSAVSRAH